MTTLASPHRSTFRTQPRFWLRRLVAVAVLSLMLVGVLALFSGVVGADGPVATEPYVVRSGDTLWDIASGRTAGGDDVRSTMADIVSLNDLHSSGLSVGQVLDLPVAP